MIFTDATGEAYKPSRFLSFSDVLLTPQKSAFNSRNDPNISLATILGKISLNLPIISANMDTVTGANMARTMNAHGGMGILHRFYLSDEDFRKDVESVLFSCSNIAISIGCKKESMESIDILLDEIKKNNIMEPTADRIITVCIDVAHGDMKQCHDTVKRVRDNYGSNINIIAGNVSTAEAALRLAHEGANVIKVGVGPGSLCSTRIVTGHGVPQLTAIMHVREALDELGENISLIADGGIRNSGDAVKALAAGADAIMCGNLFAGTDESPGEAIANADGSMIKMYRGQSSKSFLDDIGKNGVAPEGEMMMIPYRGSVEGVIDNLKGGIRSGMTYSGVGDLEELREKAQFIEITQGGWIESNAHALMS